MTLWIGNGAVLKSSSQWQLKELKLNNSGHELFIFRILGKYCVDDIIIGFVMSQLCTYIIRVLKMLLSEPLANLKHVTFFKTSLIKLYHSSQLM